MSDTLKQYDIYKNALSHLRWLESKRSYKNTDTSKMYNSSLEAFKIALESNLINIKSVQYLEMDILRLEVLQSVRDREIEELKNEIKKKDMIIKQMTL